jgi:tetratricopeptide (TPR) repeat protein
MLQKWPEDFLLGENFALFLQASGDVPQAITEWRRIHELMPHDYLPYFQMGWLLGARQQWAEAESDLRMAVQLRPSLTEAWYEWGNTLAAQGKLEAALTCYATARAQRPQDPVTILRMGKVDALLNRHGEAAANYREASRLDPGNWEPHFVLGGELDAAGQLDPAREEFAAAARLNPTNAVAHYNFGVLLAKQSHYAEAQDQFNETLRLAPEYQNARDALAKIRRLLPAAPKN